ncbi:hypothetical protein CVIRNUC_005307 [Coccomyxa viridis]|uniref:Uncharacterized protein n=1 Tax=Coccomyxa viridis TaxID=1274662 RepID=A0AAV1I3Z5_9CHLO|nr:hypothetical protein CVIRNUC_005307 [Coccomyxa viridis]
MHLPTFVLGLWATSSLLLLSNILQGTGAAQVQTIIDMGTASDHAYFSEVAVKHGRTSGSLFFTDSKADCIRQWTSQGQLKTLAGDCGHPGGFRNGQGDHALFSMPRGLCYHDMDFLVIADSQNACLRRISLDGEVSTFAGQCESPGEHDGDSSEAQFLTAIQGVACLSNCSVLVTDPSSRSVRIIDVGEHCPQPAGKVPQTHSASRWHLAVWSLGGLAAAVTASAGGALLLRKALGRKIRNKRAQVEEASAAGQTHPVLRHPSKVKETQQAINYDDSAQETFLKTLADGVASEAQASLIDLTYDEDKITNSMGAAAGSIHPPEDMI